jgi:hypothetical protein
MVRISNTLTKQGVPKIISRTKGFLHQPVREGLGLGKKLNQGDYCNFWRTKQASRWVSS